METVPVIVTEEAAAQIAEWGLQRELEANLDWVRRNVPRLHGIRVTRWVDRVPPPPPPPRPPEIIIQAHRQFVPGMLTMPPIEWAWLEWALKTFAFPFPFKRFQLDTLQFDPFTEE
jgi:hypothetical protein